MLTRLFNAKATPGSEESTCASPSPRPVRCHAVKQTTLAVALNAGITTNLKVRGKPAPVSIDMRSWSRLLPNRDYRDGRGESGRVSRTGAFYSIYGYVCEMAAGVAVVRSGGTKLSV
jgi:hypothetical protein